MRTNTFLFLVKLYKMIDYKSKIILLCLVCMKNKMLKPCTSTKNRSGRTHQQKCGVLSHKKVISYLEIEAQLYKRSHTKNRFSLLSKVVKHYFY